MRSKTTPPHINASTTMNPQAASLKKYSFQERLTRKASRSKIEKVKQGKAPIEIDPDEDGLFEEEERYAEHITRDQVEQEIRSFYGVQEISPDLFLKHNSGIFTEKCRRYAFLKARHHKQFRAVAKMDRDSLATGYSANCRHYILNYNMVWAVWRLFGIQNILEDAKKGTQLLSPPEFKVEDNRHKIYNYLSDNLGRNMMELDSVPPGPIRLAYCLARNIGINLLEDKRFDPPRYYLDLKSVQEIERYSDTYYKNLVSSYKEGETDPLWDWPENKDPYQIIRDQFSRDDEEQG